MDFLSNEKLNEYVLKSIEDKLDNKFNEQFGRNHYAYQGSWGGHVERLISERFVDKYISENYTDLVAKLDTDKIMKLIEAKIAIKIISNEK